MTVPDALDNRVVLLLGDGWVLEHQRNCHLISLRVIPSELAAFSVQTKTFAKTFARLS
jgi:hypothetical protein